MLREKEELLIKDILTYPGKFFEAKK